MKDDTFEVNETTIPVIRYMAEHMPGGFFVYHADGNEEFILVNEALIRLLGCESEEEFRKLTNNSFRGFVHKDDLEETERAIEEQIKKSEYNLDYVEYRVIAKNGEVKWIRDYGHLNHTKPYGDVFYVFVDDATESHKRELELQIALEEQESQLQEIASLNQELRLLIEKGKEKEND